MNAAFAALLKEIETALRKAGYEATKEELQYLETPLVDCRDPRIRSFDPALGFDRALGFNPSLLLEPAIVERMDLHKPFGTMVARAFEMHFCAMVRNGRTFTDLSIVEKRFGRSLESNYGISEGPFLDMAKTYWTFRLLLGEAGEDDSLRYTPAHLLLKKFESDFAAIFFPTLPDIQPITPSQRAQAQREILHREIPGFDIERFLAESPYTSTKASGCATVMCVSLLVLAGIGFLYHLDWLHWH